MDNYKRRFIWLISRINLNFGKPTLGPRQGWASSHKFDKIKVSQSVTPPDEIPQVFEYRVQSWDLQQQFRISCPFSSARFE